MQASTEELCCSDVFSQKIRRKSGDHFMFQQDGMLSIERSRPWSSCSVQCRTSSNRLYGPQQPGLEPYRLRSMGALQQSMYRLTISNLEDLKDRVHTCWENLDQQIIDKSVDQWHDRLKAVVLVNGGHTKQLF